MSPKKKNKTRSSAKPAKKARKRVVKSKTSRKTTRSKTPRKKAAPQKRSAQKKTAPGSKPRNRKRKRASFVSAEAELKREFQRRNLTSSGTSPRQSEDFEGLSRAEEADSESVDELVEEGNVFEAGAVAGVQKADDSDEREVRTHEVPEDDVPEEYLDKD